MTNPELMPCLNVGTSVHSLTIRVKRGACLNLTVMACPLGALQWTLRKHGTSESRKGQDSHVTSAGTVIPFQFDETGEYFLSWSVRSPLPAFAAASTIFEAEQEHFRQTDSSNGPTEIIHFGVAVEVTK